MNNFLTRIPPDCDSHVLALLDSFIYSDPIIRSAMLFPPLGNCDHLVVLVSIDFPPNLKGHAPFHRIAYDYPRSDKDGLRDHLRDVPWDNIFTTVAAAAAASEFFKRIQVNGLMYKCPSS